MVMLMIMIILENSMVIHKDVHILGSFHDCFHLCNFQKSIEIQTINFQANLECNTFEHLQSALRPPVHTLGLYMKSNHLRKQVCIYNHIFYIRYIIYMVGKQDHINMRTRTLHYSRKKHAIIDLNDQQSSYPLWIAHRLARGPEMPPKVLAKNYGQNPVSNLTPPKPPCPHAPPPLTVCQ